MSRCAGIAVQVEMSQETNDSKPTETDVKNTPPEEKNVDRDGRERMPNQQTGSKDK